MTIRITNSPDNASINGVRFNHVLLLAGHDAEGVDVELPEDATADEYRIAAKVRTLLKKLHTKGYAAEQARGAVHRMIVEEARLVGQ